MRLPNSYGTVRKLSGKRRRPYIAQKFVGTELVDGKARSVYATIGYYASRTDALQALAEYNRSPYDIGSSQKTFAEVYEEWSKEKFAEISRSMRCDYRAGFRYCSPLHSRTFRELNAYDLESVFKTVEIPRTMVHRTKNLLTQMYNYAMRHDIVDRNVADVIKVEQDNSTEINREVFSKEEIDGIFEHQGDLCFDVIIFMLYSGMRPSEACDIKLENVHLKERYLTGGGKTKAGMNRRIPLHDRVFPIIERHYKASKKAGCDHLFMNAKLGMKLGYTSLMFQFKGTDLRERHQLYDCRHTFATRWHELGLDGLVEKLILGHAITDITLGTYTHITTDRLLQEIRKFEY